MEKTRVLIVDDSALVRQLLTEILNQHPQIEVVGTAADPYAAAEKIRATRPDVITLDVEMPRMDGLEFLQRLMAAHPCPVVMVSSWTKENSKTALKALELGAVDVVAKPQVGVSAGLRDLSMQIIDKVLAASRVDVGRLRPVLTVDKPKEHRTQSLEPSEKVIVIGASTGGTRAITRIVAHLQPSTPGILVVQHMPEYFTKSFADSLDRVTTLKVKEAINGDRLMRGQVLIAPGNYHTALRVDPNGYYVAVTQGPLINRHRPSVGHAFASAAKYAGRNGIGIILTGMGDDGARELKLMRDQGAVTIAQDEASSVVFGMPRRAIELGSAQLVMSLDEIAEYLQQVGTT